MGRLHWGLCLLGLLLGCKTEKKLGPTGSASLADLVRMPYNHPGLTVDLGVGLWANPLPVDYDQDGDYDLLVSCKDVPFNGIYFFENKNGTAFPVFEPPVRVADPIRHLQVSQINGKARFLRPGEELTNFTQKFTENPKTLFPGDTFAGLHNKIRFNQWKYVDYENDGDLDILVGIQDGEDYGWDNAFNAAGEWTNGPLHGYVYLIENTPNGYALKGQIQAGDAPIDVYGAPSPNMADFDQDGDLDLICGEFLDRFSWFENIGTRENPKFAPQRFLENESGILKMDLEMILPTAIDWDRDGDIDLVVGDEDGRVAWVENTGKVTDHMPVFKAPRYFKQRAQDVKFGALATPVAVDWDQDGDQDLICGNSAGYIGFIEKLEDGATPKWAAPVYLEAAGETIRLQAGYNGSIQGPCEAKWGYTTLSVADWDGDGLHDIIVNSIWGRVLWYKNIGSAGSPKLAAAAPLTVAWPSSPPKPHWNWWDPQPQSLATQWRTTPMAFDWNRDGHMDLIMLDHEGYLAYYERFEKEDGLWLKPPKRIFYGQDASVFDRKNKVVDSTTGPLRLNNGEFGKSGRRKLALADWDADGDIDIIVNGTNAVWFENVKTQGERSYFTFKGALATNKLAGHTTSPTILTTDQGQLQLLLGAEDGYFYKPR
ncbi:FG-GAP repeat domain-containing protein [Sediminicola luteus]|uniref:VCBS repeat-containing protein n=1 Tax=Sediminicola luteus TaxID=319238 RepID=A0A2A4G475_9FLAO|nr:VCBS repeat-containing protein [Sediminicola luteus]PCE62778.1 hypothetical protein B7P33_15955 [Sediminicola luteus]